MVNIVLIIVVTLGMIVLGGGMGLVGWWFLKPKKTTWKAYCYQRTDAIKHILKDSNGKLRMDIAFKDLKPFHKDTLEKVQIAAGMITHKLHKLNISTSPVEADCVEFWGKDEKIVRVLVDGDNATVLKTAYDPGTHTEIMSPIPQDRINMISQNIILRKNRLKNEKDLIASLTPWAMMGMVVVGMFGMAYIVGQSLITINKDSTEAMREIASENKESAKHMSDSIVQLGQIIENNKNSQINNPINNGTKGNG